VKINLPHHDNQAAQAISRGSVDMPYWLSILAGLPVSLCMAIMGLPDLTKGYAADFRILYLCAFIVWLFPLAYLQRRLWQSRISWLFMSLMILATTYAVSVFNNVLGNVLAVRLTIISAIEWKNVFSGLDGCWLALIAYCAIHAVLIYYFALVREKNRTAQALSMARDAQLRALRYQLHPHFLFNTLNAISALVVNDRNREANRMITHLGDFLRATLESEDTHEHALADELALTESYLNIEKARLGSRLAIAIHVGPDVLHAYVPYLLLQPLMENAIRHGIAQRSEGGQIELNIVNQDGQLLISLVNDRSDDTSPEAKQPGLKEHSCGVGLKNVMERLTNLYADQHRFSVASETDGRFAVSIAIPFRSADLVAQQWTAAA